MKSIKEELNAYRNLLTSKRPGDPCIDLNSHKTILTITYLTIDRIKKEPSNETSRSI